MKQFICPITTCRAENDVLSEMCIRCGTPLSAYKKLSVHPAQLFNLGLEAAQQGQIKHARDLFAAIVYWCPKDRDARNALAMACYTLGDFVDARNHWESVLVQTPQDNIALKGITALEIVGKKSQVNAAIMKRAKNKLSKYKYTKVR